MSGKGTYKVHVPDVETQHAALIGTARENAANGGRNTGDGTPVAIALRLKIANALITEVEQLVIPPEMSLRGGADDGSANLRAGHVGGDPEQPSACPRGATACAPRSLLLPMGTGLEWEPA